MNILHVLEQQRKLNERMGNPMGRGEVSAKENMLALMVEATEVLNEVNWKPWAKATGKIKVVDRTRLIEELVDVLQFWANAVNDLGYTADDVQRAYDYKLSVCYERMAAREGSDNVVALDTQRTSRGEEHHE